MGGGPARDAAAAFAWSGDRPPGFALTYRLCARGCESESRAPISRSSACSRQPLRSAREASAVVDYAQIQAGRAAAAVAWEQWMGAHGVDLILEPSTRVVAYPRGDGYEYTDHNPLADLTLGWNVTGHPGVALPSGLGPASGLPTGIQLIARRGREVDAIQAGIDLQEHELPPLRWAGTSV